MGSRLSSEQFLKRLSLNSSAEKGRLTDGQSEHVVVSHVGQVVACDLQYYEASVLLYITYKTMLVTVGVNVVFDIGTEITYHNYAGNKLCALRSDAAVVEVQLLHLAVRSLETLKKDLHRTRSEVLVRRILESGLNDNVVARTSRSHPATIPKLGGILRLTSSVRFPVCPQIPAM